ncbi:FtsK/SpoIIIE-like protein [Bacillus phage Palmer]|uniref:FtsK/SpoIIIE protein n=2 Tax=Pagevirus TaxID=1921184 RepID=A0A0A0RT24_9CAUD|nr:FtsK/SpoIIIE-like protein [Bacillus phage Pookie]YP_009210062.1 FtsK/SpoIIIE-like protein [Bacillus phage Palmer]AIW03711.1 FtsK/SpoIIIE protein [Bacillus phage Pookie]AJK28094.1 FtsK/SpoIIIE protein [Bacillus phage Palmer]
MFEIILPAAVGGLAVLLGRKKGWNDRKSIELVFKNLKIGYKSGDEFKFPTFVKEDKETEGRTIYTYRTSIGLTDSELKPIQETLSKTLNSKVSVEYERFIIITVYHENMPKLVNYRDIPKDKNGWLVPLGVNQDGWHFHDFDAVPHMTIAGTTRFGKTVNLKSTMTYLIEQHPEDSEFILIDLKGGLEFDRYKNLKQVRIVCKNAEETHNVLQQLHFEYADRMTTFLERGINNVTDSPIKKRLFIIVDEAAQLSPESWMSKEMQDQLSECQYYLSEIARVCGGLGARLIYATQYPTADCMPRQIKMNSDIKISYRLGAGYASKVAIDQEGAEKLPSDIKGRALIKTHEVKEVQTPLITDKEMTRRLKQYVIKKRDTPPPGNDDIIEIG